MWWRDAAGTPAHRLISGMVERLLVDEHADLLAAFHATTKDIGIEFEWNDDLSVIIARIGLFIRQYDRLKLVEALTNSDLPILICGNGWEGRMGGNPHITFTGDKDINEIKEIYGYSRVVFNLNAANGASERAVMGMAAGAMVISDRSSLLDSEFGDGSGICFFNRCRAETAIEALQDALVSGRVEPVAERGLELVTTSGLWSHKAMRLLDSLGKTA